MHGAIVKAQKPSDPAARGLPVVQPAAGWMLLSSRLLREVPGGGRGDCSPRMNW